MKILHIDDNEDDLIIFKHNISKLEPKIKIYFAKSGEESLRIIQKHEVECIVSDFNLGMGMSGLDIQKKLAEQGKKTPFIFLTGHGNEEVAAEAFRSGAADYFTKDYGFFYFQKILNSIKKNVSYYRDALEKETARKKLEETESRFKAVFENSIDAMSISLENEHLFINKAYMDMFGYKNRNEILRKQPIEMISPSERELIQGKNKSVLEGKSGANVYETKGIRIDGSVFDLEVHINRVNIEDKNYLVAILRDISERKSAAIALAESEERYRRLVELNPKSIAVHVAGKIAFLNPIGVKMIGAKSLNDILGKNVIDFVHPDFREAVINRFKIVQQNDNIAEPLEEKFITLDQKVIDVEVIAIPITYGGQKASLVVVDDITEKKKTEAELKRYRDNLEELVEIRTQELKESEEKFRALTENSVDVIMRFDKDLKHMYVNPVVETQTGIPVKNFIGRSHAEMEFPLDLVEKWESALKTVFKTGKTQRIEFQLPNEIWIDWMLVPEFAPDGKVNYVITTARDITEIKKKKNEIERLNEELNRKIEERTSDLYEAIEEINKQFAEKEKTGIKIDNLNKLLRAIRDIDKYIKNAKNFDSVIKYVLRTLSKSPKYDTVFYIEKNDAGIYVPKFSNDAKDPLFNTWRENALNELKESCPRCVNKLFDNNEYHIILPNDPDCLKCKYSKFFINNIVLTLSLRSRQDIPGFFFIKAPFSSKFDEEEIELLTELIRDLEFAYESFLTSRELRRSKQTIEKINRELEQFTHTVSHDLKTPLRNMIGYLELSLEAQENERNKLLNKALAQGEQMEGFITKLLKLSKAGKAIGPARKINSKLLINEIIEIFGNVNPEAEFKIKDELPEIYGDMDRLREVFQNIISNSILYADPKKKRPAVSISCSEDEKYYIFKIEDNGIGMSPADVRKLFPADYPSSITRKDGHGFGLAIARQIIEAHRGKITVESEKGKGSSFYIHLPKK